MNAKEREYYERWINSADKEVEEALTKAEEQEVANDQKLDCFSLKDIKLDYFIARDGHTNQFIRYECLPKLDISKSFKVTHKQEPTATAVEKQTTVEECEVEDDSHFVSVYKYDQKGHFLTKELTFSTQKPV